MKVDKSKVDKVFDYIENDYNIYNKLVEYHVNKLIKKRVNREYVKTESYKELEKFYSYPIRFKLERKHKEDLKLNESEIKLLSKKLGSYIWENFIKDTKQKKSFK